MDRFYEQVVIHKNNTYSNILYILANMSMIILGCLGILLLQSLFFKFNFVPLIIGIICVSCATLLFFFKNKIKVDFEYTLTNGELDFAKVFNNVQRKELGSLRINKVEYFGKVESSQFKKLFSIPNVKKFNWFLNQTSSLYYFFYYKDKQKTIIIFEPDTTLIRLIQHYLPHGVKIDE